jgi:hypothetical protein
MGGVVLGNWYLSFPSHAPLAPVARIAAPTLDDAAQASARATTVVADAPAQSAPLTITVSDNRVWPSAAVSRTVGAPQADASAQSALTRDLQSELARLGCYSGPLDGRWSPAVRYALQDFTIRVNSTLSVDGPDVALLSLARSETSPVCGASATVSVSEQMATGAGSDTGLLPDGAAVSLDGRMSLGVNPGSTQPRPPFSSRRASKDERIFTHPLGQF